MSYADKAFISMCKDVLNNGTDTKGELVRPHWEDGEQAFTIKKFGVVNRYDLSKEFPALTLRKTGLKNCVDEILWIYQKQTNDVSQLNSHIWDSWKGEDGTIGKAYGYQINTHPSKDDIIKIKKDDTKYDRAIKMRIAGNINTIKNLTYTQTLFLETLWHSILDKVKNNEEYTVDESWYSLENFMRDCRYIPQWGLYKDQIENCDLNLSYFGTKHYSLKTCVWILNSEKDFYKQYEKEDNNECTYLLRHKLSRNQINEVIFALKNNPYQRRIMTNFWNFEDMPEKALVECAYSMTYSTTKDEEGNLILNSMLNQRSNDILTANNWNVVQYSVLTHMLAQVSGMKVGEFVHIIADAHIYDRHIDLVKELIEREPLDAPKFWINPDIKDFYDFTVDDFKLIDYNTHEQIKNIPIAI